MAKAILPAIERLRPLEVLQRIKGGIAVQQTMEILMDGKLDFFMP
jgi:hypothetical protein